MDRSKTCLLIDDDQDDQDIFMIALKDLKSNIQCHTANNAVFGLQYLDSHRDVLPDYIFLDLNMPGMNGKQCLAEIRRRAFLENVPVVIYSTSAQPRDIDETKSLGATGFITKPVSIKTLAEILSDFFQTH